MNRGWHRIMAMLLVVAVCISVLPIQGFADVSALPAVVTVPLTNSIMGDEPYQEATFTYQIIAQSTDALGISDLPMPAGSAQDAQESEVNVYGGTTTQIPSIVFTKPGNYTYKVKQVRVSDEGYEGDGAEYTLIFHVTQAQRELGLEKEQTSDQTTLEATTEIQKFGNRVEGLVFNNRYTLPRFQVSFDGDGAKDAIGTQSVRYEMLAEQPDTPEKDGYVFGGWIDEASGPYNFLTPVTKDVHLKATWAKEMYFVEFREDVSADEPYKDEVLSAGRYSYGESVVAPPVPNHKLGYKFKGWQYTDSSGTSFVTFPFVKTGLTENVGTQSTIALQAVFEKEPSMWTTYNFVAGNSDVDISRVTTPTEMLSQRWDYSNPAAPVAVDINRTWDDADVQTNMANVASATVTASAPAGSAVRWLDSNGTVMGTGVPMALGGTFTAYAANNTSGGVYTPLIIDPATNTAGNVGGVDSHGTPYIAIDRMSPQGIDSTLNYVLTDDAGNVVAIVPGNSVMANNGHIIDPAIVPGYNYNVASSNGWQSIAIRCSKCF